MYKRIHTIQLQTHSFHAPHQQRELRESLVDLDDIFLQASSFSSRRLFLREIKAPRKLVTAMQAFFPLTPSTPPGDLLRSLPDLRGMLMLTLMVCPSFSERSRRSRGSSDSFCSSSSTRRDLKWSWETEKNKLGLTNCYDTKKPLFLKPAAPR